MLRTSFSIVTILCALLGASCVTESALFRDDLSIAENETWTRSIEADKRRVSIELRQYRDPLLSKKATRPHLWRLERDGKTSYLLGTIHSGIAWTSFPLRLKTCLERAQRAIFEVRLDRGPSAALTEAAKRQSEREAAGPRASASGTKAWSRYKSEMLPVRRDVLETLSPTLAMNLYLEIRDVHVRGDESHLDLELFQEAKRLGKILESLDTEADLAAAAAESLDDPGTSVEEFRNFFEGDPFSAYKQFLVESYELALTYKTKDHAAIEALTKKLLTPQRYDALIRRRNLAWIPRLEQQLAGGPALVAVGVGHMTGDAALQKLLAARGYAVTEAEACGPSP